MPDRFELQLFEIFVGAASLSEFLELFLQSAILAELAVEQALADAISISACLRSLISKSTPYQTISPFSRISGRELDCSHLSLPDWRNNSPFQGKWF